MKLHFDELKQVDLEQASRLEWLETNGLGSFASGTVSGVHTRRYHGMLTCALQPPTDRKLLVAKIEETLIIGGERIDLAANQYPGKVHPAGFEYLREFSLDPFPTWIYEVGGVRLEKRVYMVHGQDTTIVEYEIHGITQNCHLELRPLLAFRDFHALTRANDAIHTAYHWSDGVVSLQPYPDLPRIFMGSNASRCERTGYWYHRFQYREEQARGMDFEEDLFQPFALHFDLADSPRAVVTLSREAMPFYEATGLRERERVRRLGLRKRAPIADELVEDLCLAADQFLVRRGEGYTVIAGYPWFADWGRDTMIALPGLTLVTRRFDAARAILLEFAGTFSQGMLPNRFPDYGEPPEYNTVDAALWFFEAVRAYLHYSNDATFVRDHLYQRMVECIEWHQQGTRYNIGADTDGLLSAGEAGVQLTWMDAKVGDWVVTPRRGKPVEIQALWYNALRVLEGLAERFGDKSRASSLSMAADQAAASFQRLFWDSERGYLMDTDTDAAFRPNQIFAVSLAHSMLDAEQCRRVVEQVRQRLLTPLGLRTLDPADKQYRGRYEGNAEQRDGAYHQGTVWPFLMGPYLSAHAKAFPGVDQSALLEPFRQHLHHAGLGQICEIADGDAPHQPRGCPAQAWSVAELLRATVEVVLGNKRAASTDFQQQEI